MLKWFYITVKCTDKWILDDSNNYISKNKNMNKYEKVDICLQETTMRCSFWVLVWYNPFSIHRGLNSGPPTDANICWFSSIFYEIPAFAYNIRTFSAILCHVLLIIPDANKCINNSKDKDCSCSIQTQLHFGDNFGPWIV